MRRPAFLSTVLFLSLFVDSHAQQYQMRTGRSGITVKILGMVKMHFTKSEPALMLKYQTDFAISNIKALRLEARKIWVDFSGDVKQSGLTNAILSAYAPSQGILLKESKGYNFVFQKQPDGKWTSTDKELDQWLQLDQEEDVTKKMAGLKKWAAEGDEIAMLVLGNAFQYGFNIVEKDPAEALKWYRLASQAGDAVADNNIGQMYVTGLGVEKNYKEAFQWFARSANEGNALGEGNLGDLYLNGYGVEKSYEKAADCYSKAANQGSANAMGALGSLYLGGLGVKKDYNRAFELIQQAAEWGSPTAQSNLSFLYSQGLGTKKDCNKSFQWASLAAQQRNAAGEDNLGSCYEYGCGVEKNLNEAFKYYQLSADHGNPDGKKDLQRLQANGTKGSGL